MKGVLIMRFNEFRCEKLLDTNFDGDYHRVYNHASFFCDECFDTVKADDYCFKCKRCKSCCTCRTHHKKH